MPDHTHKAHLMESLADGMNECTSLVGCALREFGEIDDGNGSFSSHSSSIIRPLIPSYRLLKANTQNPAGSER